MIEDYKAPVRRDRACRHWWFDGWDWVVNRALGAFGLPKIEGGPDEFALDLHIHTLFSHCSISQPERILRQAAKLGLDGIAIMDHDETRGASETVRCAEYLKNRGDLPAGFLVIPGVEISSRRGHIGALFLQELVPDALSPEETVRRIHDAGGLAVAVHPYHSTGIGGAVFEVPFDIVEVQCASVFGADQVAENLALADEPRLVGAAKVGTSDAHYVNAIGSCYTLIRADELSTEGVRRAIEHGRCSPVVSDSCIRLRSMLSGIRKLK